MIEKETTKLKTERIIRTMIRDISLVKHNSTFRELYLENVTDNRLRLALLQTLNNLNVIKIMELE